MCETWVKAIQKSPEDHERGVGGLWGVQRGQMCCRGGSPAAAVAPVKGELIHLHRYVLGHFESQVFLCTSCLGPTLGPEAAGLQPCSK